MRLAHSALAGMLVGIGLVSVPDAGVAQLRTKSGEIGRFHGADNNNAVCTTSTTYKNLPSAAVTFTQAANDEVVAMFQGSGWFVEQTNFVPIRLTVDGVVQPGPGAGDDTFIYGADPATEAQSRSHGFNFQTEILTAGSHTVRVQWRSFDGSEVCVHARSFIVLHR